MKRSSYRNLMILGVVLVVGVSIALFLKSQKVEEDIMMRNNDIVQLNQELENVKNISAAQIELDKLTISEQTATHLDILRHLGLEHSTLTINLQGREDLPLGDTRLYTHAVHIEGVLPYAEALGLSDKLQNAKKIIFTTIAFASAQGQPGEVVTDPSSVKFALDGRIYGLDKQNSIVGVSGTVQP